MKVFAFYLLLFATSLDTLAFENILVSTEVFQPQVQVNSSFSNPQNVQSVSWPQVNPSLNSEEQLKTNGYDELFTEIFIYVLIVFVYSLVWFKKDNAAD